MSQVFAVPPGVNQDIPVMMVFQVSSSQVLAAARQESPNMAIGFTMNEEQVEKFVSDLKRAVRRYDRNGKATQIVLDLTP